MTPRGIPSRKRLIMWDGETLYIRYDNTGEAIELGGIRTLKGNLTRDQKLKAVANTRQWVEI